MICTKCSDPIKPLVAIDIDGTLGAYHEHFVAFLEQWLDIKCPKEPWDGHGEFEHYLQISKEKYREAKLAYRQGGWKRWMPVYPGAVRLFDELRRAGCEIWIATSRPWQRLDNIDPDTMEWLRRNGIMPDGIVYGDDKYEKLIQAIDPKRIVAVVDDLREQCYKAHSLGLLAIHRRTEWNSSFGVHWSPYANDLDQLRHMLVALTQKWRNEHDS